MIAYRITDYMVPLNIMSDKSISDVIYEDGYKFNIPDVINNIWIGIHDAEFGTFACYKIEPSSRVLWQVHAMVPKRFRNVSMDCSILTLRWCCDNIPNMNILVCYIPSMFTNVMRHVESLGFSLNGILNESFAKNGSVVDQYIYSISKQTIKDIYYDEETDTKEDTGPFSGELPEVQEEGDGCREDSPA